MKNISLAILALGLVSCVTNRHLIVSLPVMSMKAGAVAGGVKRVGEGKAVKVSFCRGDKAMSTSANNVGIIDELLTRAHKVSKTKYIGDAQIFQVDLSCFELEGQGF